MIRIMILNVKKFDIVCLEFEHVCLDFKGIYERGARGCYSFTVQLRSCNIDRSPFSVRCIVDPV